CGLGTFGFDDEGVPAAPMPIVAEGVLTGYLSSRETAARIGAGSGGSMRAEGWNRMPLVRMTNLHLEPGAGSLQELVDGVADGLYLETNRSRSEEHTSELQSLAYLVCRLLLEKKK